jgi:23S rRNA (guanosine2251-2'-O)-methyltransferase
MSPASFQIRVCQNPSCGLRYPLLDASEFGDRCPMCLGSTIVAIEKRFSPEAKIIGETTAAHAVLLDNVRSAWNAGSILRSAEAFGFQQAYFCGITPTPDDPRARKTALGAETFMEWSAHKNAVHLLHKLKEQSHAIWALEVTDASTPIASAVSNASTLKDLVLVVGNEVAGVDPGILEIADKVVNLPMNGHKRSFNVAVAFALAAQWIALDT